MNGQSRHPATAELAEFRAGVTDSVRGDQVAAHLSVCPRCASDAERLEAIPALLASVPPPAMPGDVETLITGALTAEAARRAAGREAAGLEAAGLNNAARLASVNPSVGAPALTPSSPRDPRARRTSLALTAAHRRPVSLFLAAAACLVLAIVGYQLSTMGHPSNSTASPVPSVGGPSLNAGGSLPAGSQGPAMGPNSHPSAAAFVLVITATNFRKATLQQQVRQQLTGGVGGGRATPSQALTGCVTRLTGNARPALVEQADYQSRPVYMVALANHAWVVARGCTAGNPEIIASVGISAP